MTNKSWIALLLAWPGLGATVEFNRDIRPILSDKCYTCHGPDKANRKSLLRFDNEAGAMADLGGHFAIVPGDPAKSEMVRRVTSENKALRMPPVYSGVKLSDREIELIRDWIAQGAKWEKHWSFIPPKRPEAPQVSDSKWVRNPIDAFVLARLDREGLNPSPEAERGILLRRVALDLTGIPPTPAEVAAFVRDGDYEKQVDRLLASPRYGERMAARWLDAARYADTNGYQTDGERSMWRWRDWVIDAFNRNMRYDQFTIEQIAGDMLPNATLEQKIASGFNRNHRGNGEGGIVPAEYAVEYVVDRVDTTSTVWLGLTLGCSRCHDHKYDPFLQKEYYQLFSYFNNVPERGMAFKFGNSPPFIPAPTPDEQAQMREADRKVSGAQARFAKFDIATEQRKWEKSLGGAETPWALSGDLVTQHGLETLDGKKFVDGGDAAKFGYLDKFTLAAWVNPAVATGTILSRMEDVSEGKGYGLFLKDGKVMVSMVNRWLDDGARVVTETALPLNAWSHVAVTYDGSRLAAGIHIYVNGVEQKLKTELDMLNQTFLEKEPLRIGGGGGPENRFRGSIDEIRIYDVALTPSEAAVVANRDGVAAIAAIDPANRTQAQADKIRLCFLDQYASPEIRQAWADLRDAGRNRQKLAESFPTVMVMQERPQPRDTFILLRGAYDKPGAKVSRGVPGALPPLPAGAPNNRLGLAKWLVDPSNPLTARVMVNRLWQMYFGVGIVKTVEDFGSQGEWPTHPELLDWLATEFMRTGWDIKAIAKTIVMSNTYRQASAVSSELEQRDPENRLMARGPRFRMPAEMVRDQALEMSGLLVEKIGGPSVKPYQPAGLWEELAGGAGYKQDKGESLYRRSMYTFWKRAVAPPEMMTFDAAGREACIVRENRTNTPLQALTLMNDVTYLEAARKIAERMMKEGGKAPAERIAFGFRLATAREPSPRKSAVLLQSFQHYLDAYQTDREAARKLLNEGESPRDEKLNASELAAYSTVASLILNLDETVTKE